MTNAHCQIESLTDVDQVEKVHGKRRRRRTETTRSPKTPRFWRICFFNGIIGAFLQTDSSMIALTLWASRNAWMTCAFIFNFEKSSKTNCKIAPNKIMICKEVVNKMSMLSSNVDRGDLIFKGCELFQQA